MDMIQAYKEWAEIEAKLDKKNQIFNNLDSSNSIIKLAIDIINIMNNNKAINLKINNNNFSDLYTEFIHHIYLIYLHITPKTNNNIYNIFINEFNNNNFEEILSLIKIIINNNIVQNNIDNILYNLLTNNDNIETKFKYNLNNSNNKDNQYEIFNNNFNKDKNIINNKLNEFQLMLLDNISIIHDSLGKQRKISYCRKFKINRNNSHPKINKYPIIISNNYNTNNLNILNNNNNIKYIKNINEYIRNGFSIDINKILEYRKFQIKSYVNDNSNNNNINHNNSNNKITKIYYHNYYDINDVIDSEIRKILRLYENKTFDLQYNNKLNIENNENYNFVYKNNDKFNTKTNNIKYIHNISIKFDSNSTINNNNNV